MKAYSGKRRRKPKQQPLMTEAEFDAALRAGEHIFFEFSEDGSMIRPKSDSDVSQALGLTEQQFNQLKQEWLQ